MSRTENQARQRLVDVFVDGSDTDRRLIADGHGDCVNAIKDAHREQQGG